MDTNTTNFIYFLAAIGGIWFIVHISLILWNLLKTLFPRRDHLKNYGEKSWAVITGATQGIGLAFTHELALMGFNICMISRNSKKLSDVENSIRQEYPSIQTKVIVADFTYSQEQRFFQRIIDDLKTIDVGILINNVGICVVDQLKQVGLQRIKQEINVNCVSHCCLTALLIPIMLQRPLRSGIINVSSTLSLIPSPYMANYSGTKGYINQLSKGVQAQVQDKIDVLCVLPFVVETKLSGQTNRCDIISPEECAKSSLDKLGIETETQGHWKHRLVYWFISQLPESIVNYVVKSSFADLNARKNQQPQ